MQHWRRRLLAPVSLLAALAADGAAHGARSPSDPYSHEAIAKRDYRGVTLHVLTLATAVLGEPVVLHAGEFEKLTGAKVNVTRVPFPELYPEALLGLRQDKYGALTDFVAAQDLYPKGGQTMSFFDMIRTFGRGNVVFTDSWDDPFVEAMEPGNPLRNKVAAALSPGSRKVWNRTTGKWDEFPNVNYAPYIVYGWTSGVAKASKHKDAAFDFLGFYANRKNHQADLLVGRFGMNPFRRSDLDTKLWTGRAGWDPDVARSYVETLQALAMSRNRVLDLRIIRGQEYVYLVSVGVYRAITGRDAPQAALDGVAERWRALTQRVGIDKQREAYRHVVRFEDNE